MTDFSLLVKPASSDCPMRCDYCFYRSRPDDPYADGNPGNRRMGEDVLEIVTRKYLEAAGNAPVFSWQGGEPLLMGIPFFERAAELQRRYARTGQTVGNTFQTNGAGIDDDWARFFRRHGFLVGVSLDGPREITDLHRRDARGEGLFDRVMRGIDILDRHGVEYNILAVVNADSARSPGEIYRFFRAGGVPILRTRTITSYGRPCRFTEEARMDNGTGGRKKTKETNGAKTAGMSRRDFAKKAAAVGAAGALSGLPRTGHAARRADGGQRNVLLLIADDHGRGDLGCYGHPSIRTPNLDRIAENGVRFDNAFATVASCSASRSVIYSGLFNHTNGQFGHQHSFHNQHTHEWVKGVPALLNEKGYKTAIINKFHVQPRECYPFGEVITQGIGGRDTFAMAEKAKEFFNTDTDRPFFLVIGYSDPHRDWVSSNSRDYPGIERVDYSADDVVVPPYLPDRPEVREEFVQYYRSVSRLDQGIGYVLYFLGESGRADDTLVMYISDNGIPFPGAKTTLYDPGIRMPMLVSTPELSRRGIVNNAMVSFIDIVPTILDWTGADPPEYELPGRSILPVLERGNPPGWDEIFASHTFHEITMYYPMRVIRTRKYKYILNLAHQLPFPFASDLYASPTWQGILERNDAMMGVRRVDEYINRPREELYDLERDPDEVDNLAGRAQYASVLDGLRRRLREFQERTDDPWIVKYSYE